MGTISPEVYVVMTRPPSSFDVFSWDVGRLTVHAGLVNRGVRPVAEVVVRKESLERLLADPDVSGSLSGVQYHLVLRGEHHIAIYLFKHSHLREIVKHMSGERADIRVFTAWVNGKMFGYADDQIAQFIADKEVKTEKLSL